MFSKAKTKRFNEITSCAPPVGSYDPKSDEKVVGAALSKTDRFNESKLDCLSDLDISAVSNYSSSTPQKNTFQMPGLPSNKKNRLKSESSESLAKIRDLERQVKHLNEERKRIEKKLIEKEEEYSKLDGRIQQSSRDKSACTAKIATLEKQISDLTKANNVLKNKITTSENLLEKYKGAQMELNNIKSQLNSRQTEIENLNNTTKKKQKELDNANLQLKNVTKTNNELVLKIELKESKEKSLTVELKGLESKMLQVNEEKDISKKQLLLAKEKEKELREKFDSVNQGSQKSLEELKENLELECAKVRQDYENACKKMKENLEDAEYGYHSLSLYKEALVKEITGLKHSIRLMKVQKMDYEDQIRYLKGEIFAVQDENLQCTEALSLAQKEIKALSDYVYELQSSETKSNFNTQILTTKCQNLELDIANSQIEYKSNEKLLENDIKQMKQNLSESLAERNQLQESNTDLLDSLNNIKVEKIELEQQVHNLNTDIKSLKVCLQNNDDLIKQLRDSEEEKISSITKLNVEKNHLVSRLSQMDECFLEEQKINNQNISNYENRITEAEQQLTKLQDVVDEERGIINDMMLKLEDEKKSKNDIQIDLDNVNDEKQNLEKNYNEVSDKLTTFEKDSAHKKEDFDHLNLMISEKNSMIDNLQLQLAECDIMKEKLVSELSQKEESVLKINEYLSKEKDEKYEIIEQLKFKDDNLKILEDQCKEFNDLTLRHEKCQSQINELQEIIVNKECFITELSEKVKSKEFEIDNFCSKIISFEEREKVNNSKQELLDRIESMIVENKRNNILSNGNEHIIDIETEITNIFSEYVQKEVCITDLQTQISSKENEIKVYIGNLSEMNNKFDEIQELFTTEKDANDALTSQLKEFIDKDKKNESELKSLQNSCSELSRSLEAETSKSVNLEIELNKQCINSSSKVNEIEELESKLDGCHSKVSSIEQELSNELLKNKELKNQLRDKDDIAIQLEINEHILMEEISQLKANTKQSLDDEKLQLIDRNNEYQAITEQLKNELCIQTQSYASFDSKYQESIHYAEDIEQQFRSKCEEMEDVNHYNERLSIQVRELQDELSQIEEEYSSLEREKTMIVKEKEQIGFVQVKQVQDEFDEYRDLMENQLSHWRTKYEDLWKKVLPFQDQLEAYEMEKNALFNQHKDAASAIEKLGREYAKLLGHQNHKQKIHYTQKIVDENNALKLELSKMREDNLKLKKKLTNVDDRKKFDPSKAFTSKKENEVPSSPVMSRKRNTSSNSPQKTPLKELNRR